MWCKIAEYDVSNIIILLTNQNKNLKRYVGDGMSEFKINQGYILLLRITVSIDFFFVILKR